MFTDEVMLQNFIHITLTPQWRFLPPFPGCKRVHKHCQHAYHATAAHTEPYFTTQYAPPFCSGKSFQSLVMWKCKNSAMQQNAERFISVFWIFWTLLACGLKVTDIWFYEKISHLDFYFLTLWHSQKNQRKGDQMLFTSHHSMQLWGIFRQCNVGVSRIISLKQYFFIITWNDNVKIM